MQMTRRGLMQSGAALAVAPGIAKEAVADADRPGDVLRLSWLGNRCPASDRGVVWGVPWPRGRIKADTNFKLMDANGDVRPLQSWPLAYWPDGSLKWVGHAAVGLADLKTMTISVGRSIRQTNAVKVREAKDSMVIETGALSVTVPRDGNFLISSLCWDGREIARKARLVVLRREPGDSEAETCKTFSYDGRIDKVVVEQRGPVRAVLRLEGRHHGMDRAWLPFVLRLSVFAGSSSLSLMHSFTFDGDARKDFLSGMGVRFEIPLREELQNRHIRFCGDETGVWSEAVRNLPGWTDSKFAEAERYPDQLQGKKVPNLSELNEKSRRQLESMAIWSDFKLVQDNPDYFSIRKRTVPAACWLAAGYGHRSRGLAYVGDTSGGLAFGLRDFWQKFPTALEVRRAASDGAEATVWLWSPDAAPMDMRHYDVKSHGLEINYEDVQPGRSTPYGMSRSNEILLRVFGATPQADTLVATAKDLCDPPLPVATPSTYHALGLFGIWSLPDRSSPVKARMEAEIEHLTRFYLQEVEHQHWYGFWDYGDVRHSYDARRHVWRYDIGGYAWSNSELVPDLWLWYAFLRSGDPAVFRMAEAMTRHTGEVDVHHSGPFAMLGSRHNVSHWGCGAKEARISQALLRRFYYYLTADERTGDLMALEANADFATVAADPLGEVLPKSHYPTHARSGPDWLAFVGNWLTAWERTGDTKWRDKILIGMNDIAGMPHGLFSGPPFGYDPASGHLYDIGAEFQFSYHLTSIFGGAEVMFELLPLVDAPKFADAWLTFCRYYNAPEAERTKAIDPRAVDRHFVYSSWYARLTAYAAWRKNDPALGARAWRELLYGMGQMNTGRNPFTEEKILPPNALHPGTELPWSGGTNHVSQWSLNLIELLALAPDQIPDQWEGIWRQ